MREKKIIVKGAREHNLKNINVDIKLGVEVTREITDISIETINLDSSYKAVAIGENSSKTSVVVKGTQSVVDAIDDAMIKAQVDLSGYNEGEYEVEVKVEEGSIEDFLNINNYSYNYSYVASRYFIEDELSNNYDLIIDLHRDAISRKNSVIKINEKNCAKIMFVIGKKNKNYKKTNRSEENHWFRESLTYSMIRIQALLFLPLKLLQIMLQVSFQILLLLIFHLYFFLF